MSPGRQSWYSLAAVDGAVSVTIRSPATGRYWPLAVMAEDPLPTVSWAGRRVAVTGLGPVVFYAHLGVVAARNGATSITVDQPQGSLTFAGRFADTPAPAHVCTSRVRSIDATVVRWDLPRTPDEVLALDSLAPEVPDLDGVDSVILAGRAPVALYAAAAFAAHRAGATRIGAFSMPDGVVVVHDAIPGLVGSVLPVATDPSLAAACGASTVERGVALGVAGDPNCGKSVLSQTLDAVRVTMGGSGWRFDCDLATPTATWFLELVAQGREDDARDRRDPLKSAWTPELEARAAELLRGVKRHTALVVTDLPGGRHKLVPPVRVPVTRQALFREIDRYVLLGRDQAGITAWRAELAALGIDDRIHAEVVSRDPGARPGGSIQRDRDGIWRGTLLGLDRTQSTVELVDGLREALIPLIAP